MLQRTIVVGASSGIGEALVRSLCRSGHRVVAVARRGDALSSLAAEVQQAVGEERVWPLVHDVTAFDTVPDAFERAVRWLGGLDVVVYAAGVMPAIDERAYDAAVDRHVIEVNLLGAMAWIDCAALRFRAQRRGLIVGIGSVAGDRGRRGNPAYCTSKAALHTFLESLRNRLACDGVDVLTVKPGPVRTPMTEGLGKLPMVIEAEDAARAIISAIDVRRQVVYIPGQWRVIMAVVRAIPSAVFRRMSL